MNSAPTQTIFFTSAHEVVMELTANGITVPDGVEVNDAAKVVLELLDGNIKELVSVAVQAERARALAEGHRPACEVRLLTKEEQFGVYAAMEPGGLTTTEAIQRKCAEVWGLTIKETPVDTGAQAQQAA